MPRPSIDEGWQQVVRDCWPGLTQRGLDQVGPEIRYGEADREAARRLSESLLRDVSVQVVAFAAHRLWGYSLTDEREARLTADRPDRPDEHDEVDRRAQQALRGHVTRELIAELESALKGALPPLEDQEENQ